MNRETARYLFEHRILPKCFFDDKSKFVGAVMHDKNVLYRMLNGIFEKEKIENPYSADDFQIEASKVLKDVMVLRIDFPKPEAEPLCYRSYLFFDEQFEKISYFCIERGNAEDGDAFVCSWSVDGVHANHGSCRLEEFDDFVKCADIHMEKMYGLKRDSNPKKGGSYE